MLAQYTQGNAPFFLQCSFPDPHHPFTPPGTYWDMFQPGDVSLPPSFDAELTDPPPPIAYLREQRRDHAAFRPGHGSFACSEQEAREAIALNHGSLANIDDGIGRVLAQLQALGLADNTVVMFTSDHGDLLGDRGLMFKGGLHYPALTRVPFIWRDPAAAASTGASTPALTQTIDIAPTVLARAGLAPANGMQGQSLLSLVDGSATQVRERLLIEEESQRRDFGMDRRVRLRTLRDHQHRLTLYDGQDWGELYDLTQDPLELRNLWFDAGSVPLRQGLAEQLARAMLSAADGSPYPDAMA
jgi:arylsulfatase A-like enzyme